MRYSIFILVLLSLYFSNCQRNVGYMADNFDDRTQTHRVIAVLPAEINYTGRLPADWTEEEENALRLEESTLLQSTVQSALLERAKTYRNGLRIDFQSVNTTNSRLREAGYEPNLVDREDPAKLVAALGVDAVVITSINKERYLSDEASAAISVAGTVLTTAGAPVPGGLIGRGARTYSVGIIASLVDSNGVVLYSDNSEININWQTTANESVEAIARWVSRGFPYRR